MKILIVEDDAFKSSQLNTVALSCSGVAETQQVSSLQEAMSTLVDTVFDAVLLDMAIPSHPGEAGAVDVYSQPVGGLDVLLYLSLNDRPERVMILTQYPTVEFNREHVPLQKLRDRFQSEDIMNVEAVSLFAEDGIWQRHLKSFLGVCK